MKKPAPKKPAGPPLREVLADTEALLRDEQGRRHRAMAIIDTILAAHPGADTTSLVLRGALRSVADALDPPPPF